MLRQVGIRERCRIVWLILFLLSPWMAHFASAAEDCAGTPQALIQYLNKATTQSTPYKIKVLAGTYILSTANSQWLVPTSLTLEGGYLDCNTRGPNVASATVIDGSALFPGFQVYSTTGTLKVDGLTFVGGGTTALEGGVVASGPGQLIVTHSRITQTQAVLSTNDGTMTLEDVVIDHAPIDTLSHCSARIEMTGDNSDTWKFVTVQTNANENICVDSDGHQNAIKIFNSIAWPGNFWMDAASWQQGDVFDIKFVNSLFNQVVAPQGTSSEQNSLHVDPRWVNPAAGNFTLQSPPNPISPGINTGAVAAQVPGGISATDVDVAGNARIIGSAPDMGAYESAVDDGVNFDVTTTDDCSTPLNLPSCGSLRDAVARAGSPTSTAPVKTITFKVKDASNQPMCPAVFHLGGSLPDITTNVVIDGYTQAGIAQIDPPLSWPNIDPDIFNANLCVAIVGPGSGVALRVPSGSAGSLTLRGVGIGNFTQGVMLLGGSEHQLAGNQFGGMTSNGVDLHGFSVAAINMSPSTQPSGALIIGGDNPADRNVFLNALGAPGNAAKAILIASSTVSDPNVCQIDGNLIGIVPDGTNATGNDYGLVLDGDGCTVKNNWIAGNFKGAVWVQGQHYVLQSNVLGLAPRSFAQQFNGGFGIRINGSNNVVGAPIYDFVPPTLFVRGLGNYIADMHGNGIAVATPGTGNTLRGNWVLNSGVGTLLAVDLGEDGPTGNDVTDADAGPNDLQNFPEPHALSWTAPPQQGATNDASVRVTFATAPMAVTYSLDVYLGEGCDPAGRGLPEMWIGRYSASVPTGALNSAFDIAVQIPDYYDPALAAVSFMATSQVSNSTSEISTCLPIDTVFRDGMDD